MTKERLCHIAEFQAEMHRLLDADYSTDETMRRFKNEAAFQIYAEQIAKWSPAMISVAKTLMKKWAIPSKDRGEGL